MHHFSNNKSRHLIPFPANSHPISSRHLLPRNICVIPKTECNRSFCISARISFNTFWYNSYILCPFWLKLALANNILTLYAFNFATLFQKQLEIYLKLILFHFLRIFNTQSEAKSLKQYVQPEWLRDEMNNKFTENKDEKALQ